MNRRAWQATVPVVAESDMTEHAHTHTIHTYTHIFSYCLLSPPRMLAPQEQVFLPCVHCCVPNT